jgi:CRISPR-associated protein Csm4
MKTLRLTLRPVTSFGTPLAGDTLFGHLCWAVRERYGELRLSELLDGYTTGRPFLVVSDGFPSGLLPRPTVPQSYAGEDADPAHRKEAKRLQWLRADDAASPLYEWLRQAQRSDISDVGVLTQNTINRITGTTGVGQFAPRQVERTVYRQSALLDVYVAAEESVLDAAVVTQLFEDVGSAGYGRDASTGLGKFAIESVGEPSWAARSARHWLTLAPCAPVPDMLDAARCHYQPVTRFGRHGNIGVRLGFPFKRPLLLMKTGALLAAREPVSWIVHGSGLGGRSAPLSFAIPETVHQGYAPVVPLNAEGL